MARWIGTDALGGGQLPVVMVGVKVSTNAALTAGVFRHPLRFVRMRPDLGAMDVPTI